MQRIARSTAKTHGGQSPKCKAADRGPLLYMVAISSKTKAALAIF